MAKDDSCENPTLSIIVREEIYSPRNGDRESRSFKGNSSGYNLQRKGTSRPVAGSSPYNKRNNFGGSYQTVNSDKNNVSSFTQRIMSAKLLRFKQLQNQIAELTHRIEELSAENKTLKTLQKRQDNALRKFEGSKDQLPQLIKSHSEELRIMNIKFKQLKTSYRDLENKIKQKDSELFNLREQHSHLLVLARDKQLGERERLRQKLEETEAYVKEQREKIIMLEKKLNLQEKSFRHQMQLEGQKQKETQIQLSNALSMVENLKFALEGKTKLRQISPSRRIDIMQIKNKSRMSLPTPSRSAVLDQKQRNAVSETGLNENTTSTSQQQRSYDHDDFSSTSSFEEHERQLNIIHANSKSSPAIAQNAQKPPSHPISHDKQIKFNVRDGPKHSASSTSASNCRVGATNKVSIRQPDSIVEKSDSSDSSSDSLSRRFKSVTCKTNEEHSDEYTSSDEDVSSQNIEEVHSKFVRKMNFLKSRDGSLPSMREEMEKEMEDLMKNYSDPTEQSTNSSSSTDHKLKHSFRSSIEDEIDKMINKACTGLIDDQYKSNPSIPEDHLSWNAVHKDLTPLKESLIEKIENSVKSRHCSHDYDLPENEKSKLLEALQEIDERQNKDDEVVTGSDLSLLKEAGNNGLHSCNHLHSETGGLKAQKKSDLIKKIFGESDMVPLVDS